MPHTPSVVLCRYHYDALDRLAGRSAAGQVDGHCFYQKNRLATETQGQVQYSWLQTPQQLLAQQRCTASLSEVALIGTDVQGSVLHGLDAGGRHGYAYSAYGHRHPAVEPPYLPGFNRQRAEPVTGHYLLGNGYRAFNPVLMRFNSPDSESPFGEGGLNAYAYCAGDPVNRIDPSGHMKGILKPARPAPSALPALKDTHPAERHVSKLKAKWDDALYKLETLPPDSRRAKRFQQRVDRRAQEYQDYWDYRNIHDKERIFKANQDYAPVERKSQPVVTFNKVIDYSLPSPVDYNEVMKRETGTSVAYEREIRRSRRNRKKLTGYGSAPVASIEDIHRAHVWRKDPLAG